MKIDNILEEYIKRVLADLFISKEHLNIYEKLYKLPEDNAEIYDTFKEFWYISNMSFLYSGTILLAKVFDSRDKDSITLYKIIRYSEANKPSKEVKEKIKMFHKELNKNEREIESLISQRDKFYAHNDKISPEQLLEIAHLTYGDKLKLLDLGKKICEFFLAYSLDEKDTAYLSWDIRGSMVFDNILFCLKQHKELIDNMINNL